MPELDIFRPNRDEVSDCLVMNVDGGVISNLMGRSEAEAFAARVVAGRVPHVAGTIEAVVCRIQPLSRVRDKSIGDQDIIRLDTDNKKR
jgi:hypothetical protein